MSQTTLHTNKTESNTVPAPRFDVKQAHYIVVTGIIVHNGKYLIVKRAPFEKAFPNRWTVPGGKLMTSEYLNRPMDTKSHWYNVFEDTLIREVKEEVNLNVESIGYVTSMVYMRSDNIPCIIVSLHATVEDTESIQLCDALTEYAWVTLEEATKYDLIEGIFEELFLLDKYFKTGKLHRWSA